MSIKLGRYKGFYFVLTKCSSWMEKTARNLYVEKSYKAGRFH